MFVGGVSRETPPTLRRVSKMKYILFVDEWPVLVSKNYVFLFDTVSYLLKKDSRQSIIILNERMAYYV